MVTIDMISIRFHIPEDTGAIVNITLQGKARPGRMY